jgi:DNA-binding response OmpR family regulator
LVRPEQITLMIVEDDLDIADMLNAYFRVQGYEIILVNWGEDVLPIIQKKRPDLIVLDIRLPDINGYEVAQRLRETQRYADIPIIFLTDKRARTDRLHGLALGADDYITKPFDIQELRLRIRNALRRAKQGSILNPVTELPDAALVDERLQECLGARDWGILDITIQHLDHFREAYGFVAADDVLRAISLLISSTVRDICGTEVFIGQPQLAGFIIIVHAVDLPTIKERLQTRLTQSLAYFYPLKDRERRINPMNQLAIQIKTLDATQGPFESIESLKSKITAS